MIAIISLLSILAVSLLVTRMATIALIHTGLSRESAKFQALSAFTGAGFTTNESEHVVNHPVRRRILMNLMLVGNAGIVTTISSLILACLSLEGSMMENSWNLGLLGLGLGCLLLLALSRWFDRQFSQVVGWTLSKFTQLDVKDYDSLLQLSGAYRVAELYVDPEDWLASGTLGELKLRDEGVNCLGVQKGDGSYEGNPKGDTRLEPGDTVILYGRSLDLEALDTRRRGLRGDLDHRRAVEEQANRDES